MGEIERSNTSHGSVQMTRACLGVVAPLRACLVVVLVVVVLVVVVDRLLHLHGITYPLWWLG